MSTPQDELTVAKKTILTEARVNRNAIYIAEANGDNHVRIGGELYGDNTQQRLKFLAALKALMKEEFVCQISDELYELTYPGWLEACRHCNEQPEHGEGCIERAKQSLLVGAAVVSNGVYLRRTSLGHVVGAGNYCYNDSEEQRLLYIYALKCLLDEELVDGPDGQLFELTDAGHTAASQLVADGIAQDKPNP